MDLISDANSGVVASKYTTTLITETKKHISSLIDKTDADVLAFLARLALEPRKQILNEEDESFVSTAHSKIYKYSEINLHPKEVRQLIIQLLSLIEKKSSYELNDVIDESALNKKASICVDDLLEILAISRPAYYALLDGGDPNAIKSVSILQRILKRNNFKEDTINSFAEFKSQWETWYRKNRHYIQEFKLLKMKIKTTQLAEKFSTGKIDMDSITEAIERLTTELRVSTGRADLTEDLVFGSVLSEIVKGESL